MRRTNRRILTAAFLAVAVVGCSAAPRLAAQQSPAEVAKADKGLGSYTKADIAFMQGMIHHHAQAVVMAKMAPKNGARPDVRVLCERISVGQTDEIALMQRWLKDRGQYAPDPLGHHDMAGHEMASMNMGDTLMPGMLSAEQMKQLEAARGSEFDRLFLTFMIQHHEGALEMTHALFSSVGAGQEVTVFKFASDVEADQSTEIDRMTKMLAPPTTQ